MGIWKQLITYDGIAWMTDLRKTPFPALDIGLSEQPLILFHMRSNKKRKTLTGDLPTSMGIPK
jgi:hypothetical protein